jgi:hypothetical protein
VRCSEFDCGQNTYTADRFNEISCADGTLPVDTREECVIAGASLLGNLRFLIYKGRNPPSGTPGSNAPADPYKQHGTIPQWRIGVLHGGWPKGCIKVQNGFIQWNGHNTGGTNQYFSPICKQVGVGTENEENLLQDSPDSPREDLLEHPTEPDDLISLMAQLEKK